MNFPKIHKNVTIFFKVLGVGKAPIYTKNTKKSFHLGNVPTPNT